MKKVKVGKAAFFHEVEDAIKNGSLILSADALEYWNEIQAPVSEVTENGAKILKWMQENVESTENIFSAVIIGNGIFASSRQVTGSMNGLVNKGFVSKKGKAPVIYSLTEKGKDFDLNLE